MKMRLLKLCALLCMSLFVFGCASGGDGEGDDQGGTTPPPPSVMKIDMTTDKVNLDTSADDFAEITITTRDINTNGALGNIDVDLSSTAGILLPSLVTTNASGTATLRFSAGPEKSNQVVVVTASSGTSSKDLPITISGTTLTLNSDNSSLLAGVDDSTTLTVDARDANSNPVSSAAITLTSALGNRFAAGGATGTSVTVTTGANGTATATLTALDTLGVDTITASGLGTQAAVTVNVVNARFVFTEPAEKTTIPVETTTSLTVTLTDAVGTPINGQLVTFTTTGGYFDNVSGKTSTTALTNVDGLATVAYTASNIATPADITATTGVESDTLRLLVAATDPTQLSLQASPSVLSPSIGDVSSFSTITAIVRDPNGQLVSGETVVFTLVAGPGGGESITPGTAITDASGTASVSFVSGSATSAQDSVIIQAVVQSKPAIYAETELTIGNTATSIVIGTTNVISEEFAGDPPLAVGYALPFSILVVDINGNAIPNATVNLGAYPLFFYTGYELDPFDVGGVEFPPSGSGVFTAKEDGSDPIRTGKFRNEDLNRNGFLEMGEDGAIGTYGDVDAIWYRGSEGTQADTTSGMPNGRLDPGGVVTLPITVVTDADGLAAFELKYAKGFGNWVDIEISASTQVFGDLSSTKIVVPLKVLYGDVPYPHSPFGF